jgi:hypothetical protein
VFRSTRRTGCAVGRESSECQQQPAHELADRTGDFVAVVVDNQCGPCCSVDDANIVINGDAKCDIDERNVYRDVSTALGKLTANCNNCNNVDRCDIDHNYNSAIIRNYVVIINDNDEDDSNSHSGNNNSIGDSSGDDGNFDSDNDYDYGRQHRETSQRTEADIDADRHRCARARHCLNDRNNEAAIELLDDKACCQRCRFGVIGTRYWRYIVARRSTLHQR